MKTLDSGFRRNGGKTNFETFYEIINIGPSQKRLYRRSRIMPLRASDIFVKGSSVLSESFLGHQIKLADDFTDRLSHLMPSFPSFQEIF